MKRAQIIKRLLVTEIMHSSVIAQIIESYNEPHRYYHNWQHIEALMANAQQQNILTDNLFLAILFHDVIYNPQSKTNELESAEYLKKTCKLNAADLAEITEAILDTAAHKPNLSNLTSVNLCTLDTAILNGSFAEFIDFEHKIFKEYQVYDYNKYKAGRIEVLKELGVRAEFIEYVQARQPNIAVYAGSFNPFHKGHYNILQKAEQIFDKVIIARGINPEKQNAKVFAQSIPGGRQFQQYEGLLTDFISNLGYNVTLVRGLRNATDLEYEKTQLRFLQHISPKIKVVNIICDAEFEHISSSALRNLTEFTSIESFLI